MNSHELHELIETTMKKLMRLSDTKGAEYSMSSDALANFKRNADRIGLDPMQIWHVYASKHYDSICTFIKDLSLKEHRTYSEPIEGRVDDLILYLILFKALVIEKEDTELVEKVEREGVSVLAHKANGVNPYDKPKFDKH